MRKSRQVAVLIAIAAAALPAPPAAATPTLHDAVLRYLQSRSGAEAVAVHDYRAKRDYLVYKDRTVWTASIVKVEILQALLPAQWPAVELREDPGEADDLEQRQRRR